MSVKLGQNLASAPEEAIDKLASLECGKEVAKHFSFGDGYRNLNHGSFGTYPLPIRHVFNDYQNRSEARPDAFIRYEYRTLLDRSREAIADYLKVPAATCVFLPNATTGTNTVLRNLVFAEGDVIIYFATIYGACEKTIEYITETTPAESYKIEYIYPVPDAQLCDLFEEAVASIRAGGKNPRIAIFDTIASLPGVRMPFERLTAMCHQHKILSCIDGAHSIGQIPLSLSDLDPDFYVSNCHKWLHVPRGCAIFYVPERNQQLMRTTLPTSHGFQPRPKEGAGLINNPLPPNTKSDYVTNFEFVGTVDNSPYLCVPAALAWRSKITWSGLEGEEAVMAHNIQLARSAGEIVASALGTEVLDNPEHTLTNCSMANIRLPLSFSGLCGSDAAKANQVAQWVAKVLVEEYDTFIAIIVYAEAWWVRVSAQVYLTKEDFEWGAGVLKEVCKRVEDGEWNDSA